MFEPISSSSPLCEQWSATPTATNTAASAVAPAPAASTAAITTIVLP